MSKIAVGTLAFLGGAFWVQTISKNFQQQKLSSPIFKACLLQIENRFSEELGTISCDKVKGSIDMLGGNADVEFLVTGTKNNAQVELKAKRLNLDFWDSQITIKIGNQVINL